MQAWSHIFSIKNDAQFEKHALEVYHFQVENNPVYADYIQILGRKRPEKISDIPFLPIELFKTHRIYGATQTEELIFKSSGTGGIRSSHYVADHTLYIKSFTKAYKEFIGEPKDQVILALLPNYIEQGESSLVYMVDYLIRETNDSLSGFVLGNIQGLSERYRAAINKNKTVVLFGVSYALLDLAGQDLKLPEAIIIETGGMKGRRKEITKEELHSIIKKGISPKKIYSEYGMTELLSQGYCSENLIFHTPSWMKILIRDPNDPMSFMEKGRTGGVNVVDLANIYSCSFIATQDLGRLNNNGFEILGRFDNAEVRGCNLLVQ